MDECLRIGLIDQQKVLLDALSYRLKSEPAFQVVCTAETVDAALPAVCESAPRLVVLDAEFPLAGAFDLATEIRRRLPGTRIVFLIGNPAAALLDQALRLPVDGIVSRSESLSRLVDTLRIAAAGGQAFSPAIEARLELDSVSGKYRLRSDSTSKGLTDRQLEILRHLARGESVKAVARRLFLSPKSVDNQKFRIMHKIGVRDKVSLALFAVREGLIVP